MCLLDITQWRKHITQWRRWGSNPRPLCLKVKHSTTEPLRSILRSFTKFHKVVYEMLYKGNCWLMDDDGVIGFFSLSVNPSALLWDIYKQRRIRSDATLRGVWSGSALFAYWASQKLVFSPWLSWAKQLIFHMYWITQWFSTLYM